jgi:uroporphyrinogen decarboxylase
MSEYRMNKIERVDAALGGRRPDRPPLSLWYHFGVQHGPGKAYARIALDCFRAYDFDWLKVMNDYFYPLPPGVESIAGPEDLERLEPFAVERSPWGEQLAALAEIARELRGKAYFVDTVFDPWQTLRRNLAGEHLEALMEREAEALLAALDVVTDNLIAYCRKSLAAGAAGIFLSIPASRELMERERFLRFCKPFVARLLEAIRGQGPMTTAHIHGKDLYMDDVLDLPVPIINWYDRGANGPSLAAVRARFGGCVMGGIDQELVVRRTRTFLREHVREGIRLGGPERFLLAGGCSIPTWIDPGAVRVIVETAHQGWEAAGA